MILIVGSFIKDAKNYLVEGKVVDTDSSKPEKAKKSK